MKRLWAPWRKKYIAHPTMKGCLFCQKSKKGNDAKDLVLERGKHSFVLLNLYPYNNGHLMVAPYRHLKSPIDLSCDEIQEIFMFIKSAMVTLDQSIKPHGYNVGLNVGRTGGAGFDKHIHFHVVPRWNGDVNFMPVIAQTKVISQSLQDLRKLYLSVARKRR